MRPPEPQDDLDRLARDLIDDPGFSDGRKRHPRATTPDEAVELVDGLYAAHEQAARHLPVLAERMGHTIACRAGCDECCRELVGVSHAEVHALAAWLARPEHAELRARVVERSRAWVAAAGARAEAALARMTAGDADGYAALRREHGRARLMCPCNEDGACAVYPARPLICRLPYVVDTAENCGIRHPPGPPAQTISSDSYERFQEMARRMVSGLEATLGHDPRGRRPLPVALLDALEAG